MADLKPKGSKARAGLFASLLLHLAFLGAAILSLPRKGPPPEAQGVQVTLQPLLLRQTPRPRIRPKSRAAARPAGAPAAARPPATAPAPSPIPAIPNALPSPAPGEDQAEARVAGLLRGSVGCSEAKFLRLSQQELDRCAKWRRAHVDPNLEIPAPIAPEKRAWFDAILASRRAPDHPPGFVCGVLIDGIHLRIPKTPPHALKLGPVPCYVVPPKWGVTEEADVGTPSKQDAEGATLTYTPKTVFLTNGRSNPGPPIDLGNTPGH